MSENPIIGQKKPVDENKPVLEEDYQAFQVRDLSNPRGVEIVVEKDKEGNYPVMMFLVGKEKFYVKTDELAAITFAISRQDQQHKLLDSRFREYVEKPVRLVTIATKDIKKGDPVIIWRREKVPVEFAYTKI